MRAYGPSSLQLKAGQTEAGLRTCLPQTRHRPTGGFRVHDNPPLRLVDLAPGVTSPTLAKGFSPPPATRPFTDNLLASISPGQLSINQTRHR
ncbi:hypothetical protein GQ607_015881 [Colletotrichum asianum]|uniref:Uncharacterized protein n=1 Tax=Colletotrichum asianum TaxID=702518 RepID=A0A8H3VUV3_9PEZI|nr:hypothetical protein GQ607_015881 [Colletotrichum asianum]